MKLLFTLHCLIIKPIKMLKMILSKPALMDVIPLMTGTYTIGTAGHFATIADAMIRLKACGIAGPVTLALFPGLYTENIIFEDTIRGCNATNTITFTSTTGVRTDVIIYTATDSAQDVGTIDLKNVKNLFKNIAVYGQYRSPMFYSKAVMLRSEQKTSHSIIVFC